MRARADPPRKEQPNVRVRMLIRHVSAFRAITKRIKILHKTRVPQLSSRKEGNQIPGILSLFVSRTSYRSRLLFVKVLNFMQPPTISHKSLVPHKYVPGLAICAASPFVPLRDPCEVINAALFIVSSLVVAQSAVVSLFSLINFFPCVHNLFILVR